MTTPLLQIRELYKNYGQVVAIDNVSLDIKKGEFMTFLGPSGSGKSTTLYIVAGFQEPSSGQVLFNGKSLLDVAPNRRNIGMVFQRYTLFPHLTVGENIAFPLRVRRMPESKIKMKVEKMLMLLHLLDFRDRLPEQMSGGQQQRVAIARALAYDPPLLLMDEPLSALDKKLREEIQYELRRIHQETGVTILYVTHDQEEALRLSDRIAVFNQGKIEQVGTGKALYDMPKSDFVAGFIGNSNFVSVKVQRVGEQHAHIMLPNGQTIMSNAGAVVAGVKARLMVRPEQMRIRPDHVTDAAEPCIMVTVRDMTYLGDTMHVVVQAPWQQALSVRMPVRNGQDLCIGSTAMLEWDVAHSQVFP